MICRPPLLGVNGEDGLLMHVFMSFVLLYMNFSWIIDEIRAFLHGICELKNIKKI